MLSESPFDRLRRAVELLKCLDGPDATWLADGITSVLSGDRDSLDKVFGIRPGPGQRRPSTLARLAERDKLYRRAARESFPGLKPAKQARELHRAFHQYETTTWRRGERAKLTCPPRHDGTVQAIAWEILHLTGRVQSERSIRQILAAS